MPFISYAQNFEDLMLWRALKQIKGGFYIDVGANDPTLYSVTRVFYDLGWCGINLEPVAQHFNKLVAERPRDINLQVGVGESADNLPFYDIPDSGLATMDEAVAEMHRQAGRDVRAMTVPVVPLADICQKYVHGEIHFLKIDVEGAEKNVLLGMDFQRWRPWIIVVEATVPTTQQSSHESWDALVLGVGYEFVYFDGLSRIYVAREHAELKPAFALPPNVHDDFILYTNYLLLETARRGAQKAEERAQLAECRAALAENKVARMQASFSWKGTVPLRWLRRLRDKIFTPRSGA